MKPPQIFYTYAGNCIDITRDNSASLEEIAAFAIELFAKPEDLIELDKVLADIIASDMTNSELDALWATTSARIRFKGLGRKFFQMARDKLAERL